MQVLSTRGDEAAPSQYLCCKYGSSVCCGISSLDIHKKIKCLPAMTAMGRGHLGLLSPTPSPFQVLAPFGPLASRGR